MKKLRLDLDSITVDAFVTTPRDGRPGTMFGYSTDIGVSCYQTRCAATCNLETGCYGNTDIDDLCTGNCTGLGVECYTADPAHYACTGGDACTGQAACTHTTCTVDNVTCANC